MRSWTLFFLLIACAILEAKPLNVSVGARRAILYNPENGAILFEKEAHQPHYPASILKMATTLFILEGKKVDLDKRLIASSKALEVIDANIKQADFLLYPSYLLEHDGVLMGLEEGKDYSIQTLLHGLLLASGNDAANVLAEGISGSIDQFMIELNTFLKEKGIEQTHFQNPSGLHHPAQMTTAYDMAKIAALCFENPVFRQIVKTLEFHLPNGEKVKNTNRMLREGKYHYSPIIGGKTGYIASAGYNLVAVAEERGRRLIAVLMGNQVSGDRFRDAISLFETAFSEKAERRTLFSRDFPGFRRTLPKVKDLLIACLQEDVVLTYFPAEEVELGARIAWEAKRAPISCGDRVGELVISGPKGILTSAPLFAARDVAKKRMWWRYSPLVILSLWVFFQLFVKRRKSLRG